MNQNRYNGFINIYKEPGWTSMDAVAKLRGILGMRKIGHAGTLDPMAEGVLPVALGRATRDIDLIGDGTKEYKAVMRLGIVTDTQDTTGSVISTYNGVMPSDEDVKAAAESFLGSYEQLTPMYSARKVNGKKLYEYAREGREVERRTKQVEILSISTGPVKRSTESGMPEAELTVTCSKGTYIRTLCHDIGEKLGCGAAMCSLLRTRVGDFDISGALRLSDVAVLAANGDIDSVLTIKHPTAVSIGKFDGTHLGHMALIKELKKTAQEQKLKTAVLIFDARDSGISDSAERKKLLYEADIDYCIGMKLTTEFMHMRADDFLQRILKDKLCMRAIVAGEDVSFGYKKEGNAAFLKERAESGGFTVDLIEKIKQDEDAISSSRIRAEISAGNIAEAERLLGRNYEVEASCILRSSVNASIAANAAACSADAGEADACAGEKSGAADKSGASDGHSAAGSIIFRVREGYILPPSGSYRMSVCAGKAAFEADMQLDTDKRFFNLNDEAGAGNLYALKKDAPVRLSFIN